ncbi:MAG: DUF3617 family protein [Pseudomonadota bacterium]
MKQYAFAAILLCAASTVVQAEGLEVTPGLWETTTTMNNPFAGGEQTNTSTECVEENYFDPESMMQDAQGCQLLSNSVEGSTLTFEMVCDANGAKSNVKGVFESQGDSGSGRMDMNIDAGGMQMEMNMSWVSKRVGDC